MLVFGLSGTLLVIIPTCADGAWCWRASCHTLKRFRVDLKRTARRRMAPPTTRWGPFALLGLVIALRSFVYFGFVHTSSRSYFIGVLHTSTGTGGAALTVMLAGGARRHLVGGRLRGPLRPPLGA